MDPLSGAGIPDMGYYDPDVMDRKNRSVFTNCMTNKLKSNTS